MQVFNRVHFKDDKMRLTLIRLFLLALLLILSACNLGRDETEEPIDNTELTNIPSGKPVVIINSPQNGAEVVVNDVVIVSATATDSAGVTRVQLEANGQIVKTVSSESATGSTNFPVALDYTPRTTGDVTLEVVAYRGATASDPAVVSIKVKSNETQVTQPPVSSGSGNNPLPQIDPNDPTCRALINAGLNFRAGPGTNYDVIRVLATGTVAPIIGRLGDNSWWQLQVGTSIGWVSAQFTTPYGSLCTNVPVTSPPPSPTPRGGSASSTPPPSFTPSKTNTPQAPTATSTPGKADLVVVSISGPNNLTIPGGETGITQRYTVTISNTGSGPSRQFANTVTILPGGSPTDLGVVANLDANQTIALDIDLTFSAPGTYTIRVDADANSSVDEVSEVNNSAIITVTVN